LFLAALASMGAVTDSVVVRAATHHDASLLLAETSHPIDAVLKVMNKESDNLCAEAVLRALALSGGQREVSAEDGLSALRRILRAAGVDIEQLHLRDGSGISFYNLLTARVLGSLLAVMARQSAFDRFASTLAVAGKDGTLARRLRDMEKGAEFRGKTGTVSGVSALSGYAQAPGGRLLGVVILMQNFHGKHKPYRDIQDAIIRHCVTYSAAADNPTRPR